MGERMWRIGWFVLALLAASLGGPAGMARAQGTNASEVGEDTAGGAGTGAAAGTQSGTAAPAASAYTAAEIERAGRMIKALTPEQQAALNALAVKEGKPPEVLLLELAGSAVKSAQLGEPGEDPPPPPPPPPKPPREGDRGRARQFMAALLPAERAALEALAAKEKVAPEEMLLDILGGYALVTVDRAPSEADLEKARAYILKLSAAEQDALKAIAAKEGKTPEELLLSLIGSATLGTSTSDPGEDDDKLPGTGDASGPSGSTGSPGSAGTSAAGDAPSSTAPAAATTTASPKKKVKKVRRKKPKKTTN